MKYKLSFFLCECRKIHKIKPLCVLIIKNNINNIILDGRGTGYFSEVKKEEEEEEEEEMHAESTYVPSRTLLTWR